MEQKVPNGVVSSNTPNLDDWVNEVHNDAFMSHQQEQSGYNYMELTRLPPKINAKDIVSIVVISSRIRPTSCEIWLKDDRELAGIVEFSSEEDAYKVQEKLRTSIYGKNWRIKIIKKPELDSTTTTT